jgi:hypothetical protein
MQLLGALPVCGWCRNLPASHRIFGSERDAGRSFADEELFFPMQFDLREQVIPHLAPAVLRRFKLYLLPTAMV